MLFYWTGVGLHFVIFSYEVGEVKNVAFTSGPSGSEHINTCSKNISPHVKEPIDQRVKQTLQSENQRWQEAQ